MMGKANTTPMPLLYRRITTYCPALPLAPVEDEIVWPGWQRCWAAAEPAGSKSCACSCPMLTPMPILALDEVHHLTEKLSRLYHVILMFHSFGRNMIT